MKNQSYQNIVIVVLSLFYILQLERAKDISTQWKNLKNSTDFWHRKIILKLGTWTGLSSNFSCKMNYSPFAFCKSWLNQNFMWNRGPYKNFFFTNKAGFKVDLYCPVALSWKQDSFEYVHFKTYLEEVDLQHYHFWMFAQYR